MSAKTVLITGATQGIGLKLAEIYVPLGWKVIGTVRDPAKASQLRALSPYKIVQLDASDEASILSAAKELKGEAIDLLINNAGIYECADLGSTTKEDLMKQYEANTVGPFLVTRAFVLHLKAAVEKNGSAKVAQISSSMGSITLITEALKGYYGYRASKAALNMVNASRALNLKNDGIAAFTIHPGYEATDIHGNQGTIGTEESVMKLVAVIEKLTMEDSGKFFDYNGENLSW